MGLADAPVAENEHLHRLISRESKLDTVENLIVEKIPVTEDEPPVLYVVRFEVVPSSAKTESVVQYDGHSISPFFWII